MNDAVESTQKIVTIAREHFPAVQAIFLYGSWGTRKEWPESDVDIAILLPPEHAKAERYLMMHSVAPAQAHWRIGRSRASTQKVERVPL